MLNLESLLPLNFKSPLTPVFTDKIRDFPPAFSILKLLKVGEVEPLIVIESPTGDKTTLPVVGVKVPSFVKSPVKVRVPELGIKVPFSLIVREVIEESPVPVNFRLESELPSPIVISPKPSLAGRISSPITVKFGLDVRLKVSADIVLLLEFIVRVFVPFISSDGITKFAPLVFLNVKSLLEASRISFPEELKS